MKKNYFLAFCIPVFIILLAYLSIQLPRFINKPKSQFLYLVSDIRQDYRYLPDRSKLERKYTGLEASPAAIYKDLPEPKFYIHNVANNKSKEEPFSTANKFTIDTNFKGSDGYEIYNDLYSNSALGETHWYIDKNTKIYLKKNTDTIKLDLPIEQGKYFYFVGWIIK